MCVLALLCHLDYHLHIVVHRNAQIVSSKRYHGVTYDLPTCIVLQLVYACLTAALNQYSNSMLANNQLCSKLTFCNVHPQALSIGVVQ